MPKIVLSIDGKDVGFSANALTPRLYRHQFTRDLARDLNRLKKAYDQVGSTEGSGFEALDLEIFENVAYIMARQYDPEGIPPTPDEWLEGFNTFSIYQIFPEIIKLWGLNTMTTSRPVKK